MRNLAGYVGRMFITFLQDLSSIWHLFRETMTQAVALVRDRKRIRQSRLLDHVDEAGAHSLPLVITVSGLLGVAMAVLISFQLKELGGLTFIAGFVSIAVFREMGPLITAIIVAGRVGATYTARIGTMKVTEEILALETMAINPVRYLVVQRFLALVLSLPALTVLGSFTAVAGSFLYCTARLDIRADVYLHEALDVLDFTDVVSGVVKASVFAVLIAMIACYRGFVVEGTGEEVGRSTMVSVVWSTMAIIVFDTVLTAAFYG
ncbi:MAG: ABC transporter permease [Nitrospiraceae bacterium]|nr:ABC transporter permease [Nitrospiraceae bacterium]